MRAFWREHGDTAWQPLDLTGEPTYSEADPGGCYEANVPCSLDADLRRRMEAAQVKLEGPSVPWMGRVDDVTADGVHAWGWQTYLDDTIREALYCDATLSPWQERTHEARNKVFSCQQDTALLRIIYPAGQATGTAGNGFWRTIPTTGHSRVAFAWRRPATSTRLELFHDTWEPNATTGAEGASNTSAWYQVAGSGNLTGTVSQDIAATHDLLLLQALTTGYTPGSDVSSTFASLKVYAVENIGATGVVLPTAAAVIGDSCDRLPSYVLPAGVDYRAFITADTTDLGHLVFDAQSKESDKQAYVAAFTGYRFGWWPRLVHGVWTAVPVYEAHSTTAPDYYCAVDGLTVTESLAPPAFSAKAKVCRVFYNDAQGRTIYTDVTDTDITHTCVAKGITRYTTLIVDTQDVSVATAAGQRRLADINRVTAPGSVTITGTIVMGGTSVMPCDIEAGRIIQVDRTRNGTAVGRIVKVDKTGLHTATLTLEGVPLSPRKAIDRLIRG